jgi:hypothetical protein
MYWLSYEPGRSERSYETHQVSRTSRTVDALPVINVSFDIEIALLDEEPPRTMPEN